MKPFLVRVAEVHNCYIEVLAESREDAIDKVAEGEGDVLSTDYSYTLERDLWDAEEVTDT